MSESPHLLREKPGLPPPATKDFHSRSIVSQTRGPLLREKPGDDMNRRLPLHGSDAFQEGNILRADFDAVAGLAAVGDTAGLHQGNEPLALEGFADGVIVEQPGLADDRRADEVIAGSVLRAGFQAAAATDTAR
jgi:hypothetical protein